MSLETARAHLKKFGKDQDIIELGLSSATVELAALALGTQECRIAKSLSFGNAERALLVVTAGDMRIDNQKFRQEFGFKASMLDADAVDRRIGHAIGGVCPFGVNPEVEVYLDISLQAYDFVYPACGSHNSAIKLSCAELQTISRSQKWIDVCKPKPDPQNLS